LNKKPKEFGFPAFAERANLNVGTGTARFGFIVTARIVSFTESLRNGMRMGN
jgi:hypothetical protein